MGTAILDVPHRAFYHNARHHQSIGVHEKCYIQHLPCYYLGSTSSSNSTKALPALHRSYVHISDTVSILESTYPLLMYNPRDDAVLRASDHGLHFHAFNNH